jgi:osmotically inducible protein OsmC
MKTRKASAVWESSLENGKGTVTLGDGGLEIPYSFASRFEDGGGSNPEELVGGAHAGCFAMALAHALGEAGHPPMRIKAAAHVHLEKSGDGFAIPRIDLETEAEVPGIGAEQFAEIAQTAKQSCPLSKLLSAADISLEAKLLSEQKAY